MNKVSIEFCTIIHLAQKYFIVNLSPMNIREAYEKFGTDEQCLQYIEKMRWPDGVVRCTTCDDKNVEKYDRPAPNPKKRRSEDLSLIHI